MFKYQHFLQFSLQNEDVGNFQGWDVITRRMKDGRQVLKEYAEFLKQRYVLKAQIVHPMILFYKYIWIMCVWVCVLKINDYYDIYNLFQFHRS